MEPLQRHHTIIDKRCNEIKNKQKGLWLTQIIMQRLRHQLIRGVSERGNWERPNKAEKTLQLSKQREESARVLGHHSLQKKEWRQSKS